MGLDNDDATLYSNRSFCFLQIGDGDKAFADAYTCRMNRPDWPKAWYQLGAALMFLKVRSVVVVSLSLHQQLHIYECSALFFQDYEKACDAFLDGFKIDPGSAEIEDALRYVIYCIIYG